MNLRSPTGRRRWTTAADGSIRPDVDRGATGGESSVEVATILTRGDPETFARAREDRDVLLGSARTLVASTCYVRDLEPAGAFGAPRPCPGGDRCDLAHRLAAVEDGPAADLTVEAAARAFDSALAGSLDAVRRCRQTVHRTGACWFSSVPDVDGCADVLRAAHRLG